MWGLRLVILFIIVATGSFASFSDREKEIIGRKEPKHVFVAFVFAGTPRSLVISMVHESIRSNLIEALCPPPLCHAHSYVRLSKADNTHVPNDAVGIRSVLTNKTGALLSDKAINYALNRLKGIDGVMVTQNVDSGSTQEQAEMVEYASKFENDSQKLQHKIFRKLDPRRYSMHFNRHMAYKLMTDNEEEATRGLKYDWVIHCRLDTAWSEPINQPIFSFDPNHIYVPSMWYADVPDTFAIIPRNLAEKYFDVDLLIQPKVMCLGGPNFNPKSVEMPALAQAGFVKPEEIQAVEDALCLNMFKKQGYSIVYEKKTNTTWTTAGYSEYLLKRKLRRVGLDTYRGKDSGHDLTKHEYVIFYTFSVFITRYYPGKGANVAPRYRYVTATPMESVLGDANLNSGKDSDRLDVTELTTPASISLVCMYLRAKQFIPFGKTTRPTNAAPYLSCLHLEYLHARQIRNNPMSLPCEIMLKERQKIINKLELNESARNRLYHSECNPLDASTLTALDSGITDHNFMPFRLRFRANKCISVGRTESLHSHIGKTNKAFFDDEASAAQALNLRILQEGEGHSRLLGDRTGQFKTEDALRRHFRIAKPHIDTCINYYRDGEFMVQYHKAQLVSLLPLLGATATPQQVFFYGADEAYPVCLTMPYHTAATRMAVSQGRDWVGDIGVEHTNTAKGGDDFPPTGSKKNAGRAAEVELFLAPCAPFDWQRLHSRSTVEIDTMIRGAAHQLFLVDMIESPSASARRKSSQERIHRIRKTESSDGGADGAASNLNIGGGVGLHLEGHVMDALTVGLIRWSPNAIAALAVGGISADGFAMPNMHGSSLEERLKDSGDLCLTASSTATVHTGSAAASQDGTATEHAGLVLRSCPIAVSIEENQDRGYSEYHLSGTDTLSDRRALPSWLSDNVTSILEYYHHSSLVENPFSESFDHANANSALLNRNNSFAGGEGPLFGVKKKKRRKMNPALAADDGIDQLGSGLDQVLSQRRLLSRMRSATLGHGRRRKRSGHYNNKLGGLNRFIFVLERTQTDPTPHSPGLVIGKKPTWRKER